MASTAAKAPEGTRPVVAAHAFNVAALVSYMKENVSGFPKNVSAEQVTVLQFSHGQSNPTFYIKAGSAQYVMRKKPPGPLLPSAHQVEREYRVMTALRGTRVPVPRTYCLCTDASVIGTAFYIMEFVAGRIFKDATLKGLSAEDKFAIYSGMNSVLADLHRLDFKALGLADFGPTDNYVQRQVKRWSQNYEKAKTHDIPNINKLITYLEKNMPNDDDSKLVCLVHGDFRLDNLVFHPTQNRVVAVLDWELATLGHPTADLAYNCMVYNIPVGQAIPGLLGMDLRKNALPTEKDYLKAYMRNVHRMGPLLHWQYFVVLSMFRMCAIGQGVYKRALQGNASAPNAMAYKEITEAVAEIAWKLAERPAVNPIAVFDESDEKIARLDLIPFTFSDKFWDIRRRLLQFMDEYVYPNEEVYLAQHEALTEQHGTEWVVPPVLDQLKAKAKAAGLWNLFLTNSSRHKFGNGLTNLEYAPLCEIMGRSILFGPEVFNCSAPDTGNMEVLALYGTPAQQAKWLKPLMDGEIRSAYAMTEPMVASSDATNIECRIERDGDEYVINGRKWWASGAMDPRCKVMVLMGKSDPTQPTYKQQSMILVPMDAEGVIVERHLEVFGYSDAPHGHAEIRLVNVRVPKENLLLGEGRGFEIAQGRLGPGRIHHCMRAIGCAERVLELFQRRTLTRNAFNTANVHKGTIVSDLAESRIELSQARLLTLQAAAMMDTVGNKAARQHIAMIKIAGPRMALAVTDRAIQAHGAMGVSQDTLLARLYANFRTLRLADGPDEVHKGTIAKMEMIRARL